MYTGGLENQPALIDQIAALRPLWGNAGAALHRVQAPTLLIVGSRDEHVLDLNRQAALQLAAASRIEVVQGATHLFEEPGALEEVARLAAAPEVRSAYNWFRAQEPQFLLSLANVASQPLVGLPS